VQKRAPPPPPPPAKRPPPKNKKFEEKAKENNAMASKSRGSTAGEGENLPGLDKKELEKIANQYVKNKESFDVDIPHLLYIQKGQELRASLSKDLFDAFIKALHSKVMKLDPKEVSKINILWTEYTEGRGLVACEDEATERCVRALAGDFKHNGKFEYYTNIISYIGQKIVALSIWSRKKVVIHGLFHNRILLNNYRTGRRFRILC
jgi:hypothetical protein